MQRYHETGDPDDDGTFQPPSDEDLAALFEMLIGSLAGQLGVGRASMGGISVEIRSTGESGHTVLP